MQTRNGIKISNLTFVKELGRYVGNVNGQILTWDKNGRRSSKYKSKFDIVDNSKVYVNVKRWGSKLLLGKPYFNINEAKRNASTGHLKTIEITL